MTGLLFCNVFDFANYKLGCLGTPGFVEAIFSLVFKSASQFCCDQSLSAQIHSLTAVMLSIDILDDFVTFDGYSSVLCVQLHLLLFNQELIIYGI